MNCCWRDQKDFVLRACLKVARRGLGVFSCMLCGEHGRLQVSSTATSSVDRHMIMGYFCPPMHSWCTAPCIMHLLIRKIMQQQNFRLRTAQAPLLRPLGSQMWVSSGIADNSFVNR